MLSLPGEDCGCRAGGGGAKEAALAGHHKAQVWSPAQQKLSNRLKEKNKAKKTKLQVIFFDLLVYYWVLF